ncbi:DUF4188 domain-containing protein [Gloeocapsopsis crepidinum LEGE 06123]|uniref:DUF4188 domain-containing protein n=2 Tax=Gloeocapsopsis crepidinum TaxID=693223 RepID=A0ABR9UVF9_9CHRO|nr:DUF4188 domain-containing protein [Gloeocapsopsis crepidinum]MBE9192259.1 DUF4188 domain-containing protein [Gloeocapsopsis crepidinum LEGE 06123]
MVQIMPGRFTAQVDEPFVVFLIGMRINQFFAFSKWIPTARAMAPMLNTLYQHPEKGFLGGENFFYWRGAGLIQYWRSFEDLERFARNPADPHLAAWQHFSRAIGNDGSVGIWHETYLIEPGNYKAIYGNMPIFGLASATKHVPITGRRENARQQLKTDQSTSTTS